MSRQYLKERWCVRCGRGEPTPYVRNNLDVFSGRDIIVDLGCGNRRNTNYLISKRIPCIGIDMVESDGSINSILGVDPLPFESHTVGGFLLNYVLMFLNAEERGQLYSEIMRCATDECVVMVELYPAKDSNTPDPNSMHILMHEVIEAMDSMGFNEAYRCVRSKNADRGIFIRNKTN